MKASLFRVFFSSLILSLLFWLHACTPTAHRFEDNKGAASLPTQAPPSLTLPTIDLPASQVPPSMVNPPAISATLQPEFAHAVVEHLSIMQRPGFPLHVNAELSGYLLHSCEALEEMIEYREADLFRLELWLAQAKAPVCQGRRQVFDIIVPLRVDGLTSGVYRVEVQEQTAEFEIFMDNRDNVGFNSP